MRARITPSTSTRWCTSASTCTDRAKATRKSRPNRPRRGSHGRDSTKRRSRSGETAMPEVEVMRRDLDKEIVGKKIKSVEVTGTRSVRRHRNRKEFIGSLEGRRVMSVQRRGKYLVVRLDDAEALVIHLGMSGQLLRARTAR